MGGAVQRLLHPTTARDWVAALEIFLTWDAGASCWLDFHPQACQKVLCAHNGSTGAGDAGITDSVRAGVVGKPEHRC